MFFPHLPRFVGALAIRTQNARWTKKRVLQEVFEG